LNKTQFQITFETSLFKMMIW